MSSFDPNAEFYAGRRPTGTPPTPSSFGNVPPFDNTPQFGSTPTFGSAPAHSIPRQKLPTWAKVLIGLGIAGAGLTVLAIIAAVVIPVFLNQRVKAADTQVKADLTSVAAGMDAYYASNGVYPTDPLALGIAEPESDVAILAAGPLGYCLGGAPAGDEGAPWYYSSNRVFSQQGCL